MTPAEALEQVRALIGSWVQDAGPDSTAHAVYGPQKVSVKFVADSLGAILDAVTPDAAVTVETVEQLKALPSRAAVMDKLGDVGVLGVGGIYYPETAPVSLEYAVKHWGPFTVLTPATPERFQRGTWHHIGRGGIEPHPANPDMDRVTTDRPSGKPGAPCLTCASGEAVLFTATPERTERAKAALDAVIGAIEARDPHHTEYAMVRAAHLRQVIASALGDASPTVAAYEGREVSE